MPSRRAQTAMGTIIQWMVLLVTIIAVLGVLILWQANKLDEETKTPDGHIDWEAGYLALAAAHTPIDDGSLADALIEGIDEERLAATLADILGRTDIPATDRTVLVARRGELACGASKANGRVVTSCGETAVVTLIGVPFSATVANSFRESPADFIRAAEQEHLADGTVGWALLPGDEQGLILALTRRTR